MHPIVPLLQLLNVLGRIEGRKRLQKMVHILQELGFGFQERFQYSFYGMYSLQLKAEIDVLKREGLVSESESNTGFVVEKANRLSQLVEKFGLTDEPAWADRARYLNELQPMVLEGISTIYYLHHTEDDEHIVRERLLTLKPHLESVAEECFAQADGLRRQMRNLASYPAD